MRADRIQRKVTQEAMSRFAELPADRFLGLRRGVQNHHTSPEIARTIGLPGTVAQALHYCSFIAQSMLERYGERWLEGGELEMVFLRPVYAGDTLVIDLDERESSPHELAVECRNQHDGLVAIGKTRVAGDD